MTVPPETLVGQLYDMSEAQANQVARYLTEEYEGVLNFYIRKNPYPIGETHYSLEVVSERFDRPDIMKLLPEIRSLVEDYVGAM